MHNPLKVLAGGLAVAGMGLTAGLLATTAPLSAQPLVQKNISLQQAITVVKAAIAECGKDGSVISITVLDRDGEVRFAVRANGANPHNFELSRRKAYTAKTFRGPSANFIGKSAPDKDLYGQRELKEVIPLGGGMPIMIGNDAIGAVGISGAKGGQPAEEACAKAGIAAIQSQLS
jgi:uncharacterized protein GlcG (DUF336 family)